jgi:hypothetical protein
MTTRTQIINETIDELSRKPPPDEYRRLAVAHVLLDEVLVETQPTLMNPIDVCIAHVQATIGKTLDAIPIGEQGTLFEMLEHLVADMKRRNDLDEPIGF